jgi:hypothetical protein
MTLLLNWRVWVALFLAGLLAVSHLTVYRWGKKNVRTEWLASVAEANADARKLEQQRQRRAADAQALSTTREARIVSDAAAARVAAGGLRGDLDALQRASAQSLDAATKSVAALSSVFADCSRRYQELAEIADKHASDTLTLEQAWPK